MKPGESLEQSIEQEEIREVLNANWDVSAAGDADAVWKTYSSFCSMRRNHHPNRPSALTCCLACSLNTLLLPSKAAPLFVGINVGSYSMY